MATALYPGSFDPVTLRHLDVASRAAALFEKVIVAVYSRPAKDLAFDDEQRVDLFAKSVLHLPNVEVTIFDGLVVRMAQKVGATVIVRGLRSGADFDYDRRRLSPGQREWPKRSAPNLVNRSCKHSGRKRGTS